MQTSYRGVTPEAPALAQAIKTAELWIRKGWRDCAANYKHNDEDFTPRKAFTLRAEGRRLVGL